MGLEIVIVEFTPAGGDLLAAIGCAALWGPNVAPSPESDTVGGDGAVRITAVTVAAVLRFVVGSVADKAAAHYGGLKLAFVQLGVVALDGDSLAVLGYGNDCCRMAVSVEVVGNPIAHFEDGEWVGGVLW